jgi:hypothetical protein
MLLRVLAASIQEKAAHPLQSSMIARLTPACGMPDPQLIIFNFEEHIVTPMIILDKLGIDSKAFFCSKLLLFDTGAWRPGGVPRADKETNKS